jgi:glutathione S-transferase
MVLQEKGLNFETYEVDLANKSEEFLAASLTGTVSVVVDDGDSIYESNVVNQYLDEVTGGPRLLPEDPKAWAYARIWIASADDHSADDRFLAAVFVASVGRERGFSEERVTEEFEKLKTALPDLEGRLDGRDYLVGGFSLADVAHAGNFVRLRELEGRGEISLEDHPNHRAWIERLEDRDSYKPAV